MGLVVADATKLQGVYDEVVSRLYSVMDRVVASRPAAVQQSASVDTALEPRLQTLFAEAKNAAQSWRDRYGAVCALIMGMTKQMSSAQVEQAEAIYDEARRNLGGLQQVAVSLRGMQFAVASPEVTHITAAITHMEAAEKLRQTLGLGTPSGVDAYTKELDSAMSALRSLAADLRGGHLNRVADATAELQRLRDDLAVGLQLRHLKR
jgi:hypothetical protein